MAFGEEGEEGAKIGGNGITGMMKGRGAAEDQVNLRQGSPGDANKSRQLSTLHKLFAERKMFASLSFPSQWNFSRQ